MTEPKIKLAAVTRVTNCVTETIDVVNTLHKACFFILFIKMPMLTIPILDRLSFRDYQRYSQNIIFC